MSKFRCNSCQGEYDDRAPGGQDYYHTCPPVTHLRVRRGGNIHVVPLTDVRPPDEIEVDRAGVRVWIDPTTMLPGDARLGDTTVARPAGEHRDENTSHYVEVSGKKQRVIKGEGKGRTAV